MSVLDGSDRIDPAQLQHAVHAADPAVLFVEPRILRRVIKQDRRLTAIGFQVPHAHVYTIERERLLVIADRPELDLSPAAELPPQVILLPRPEDDDRVADFTTAQALHWYWRQLFHARVHIELEQQVNDRLLDEDSIAARVRELGPVEFAEVRHVLVKDDLLAPTHSIVDAYLEFLAVALELRYFEASDRPLYFPSIQDWDAVDAVASLAVPHAALYHQTRPDGAPESVEQAGAPFEAELERMLGETQADSASSSPQRSQRHLSQAERASRVGNNVKGAVLRMRAARRADAESVRTILEGARDELQRLVDRLRAIWGLSDEESAEWVAALAPLLRPSSLGFRSVEARLLYDLQKACIAHERGFFRFGVIPWLLSRGREPLRRPLPTLQRVLEAKRLRSAARRVPTVRVTAEERKRLETLLAGAVEGVETRLREEIRPRINGVLDDAGLVPENVPERLARGKLVEELLDRVAERGFLNMGDFRDGLSQNDLKLPDVSGPAELLRGDKLLRADRQLGNVLEGVYRPGAVYLRWPQRLSSLAFGTPWGRFLTQYVVLPFGGAFVALEGIKHVAHLIAGTRHAGPDAANAAEVEAAAAGSPFDPLFFVWVFFVGMMLMLILHRPKFRAWLGRLLTRTWKVLKRVMVDVPAEIFRAPWVQRILQSQPYLVVRNYLLRPAILTAICAGLAWFWGRTWSRDFVIQFFLGADLLLNTPIGRYADEWLADVLVRAWHELRIRVLAAAFQWVMDVFHLLLEWLERVIYTVDEWLRFRAGDARGFVGVKFLLSLVWAVLAYVVRIFVTLLIEPQVNPIKHFPVVTVAHKVLLPTIPWLREQLEPFMEKSEAYTVATVIVLLVPGVFGFLVWELKENWRLYAANRSRALAPMRVGRNGETVTALLRPGIHSGTLPKIFTRVRRALSGGETSVHSQAARKHLAAIQMVEVAVRRFVDRTLCRLLNETGFRGSTAVRAERVRLATNRIEVELVLHGEPQPPLCLRFDDYAGWLNAAIHDPGWLTDLDDVDRSRFNAALAGFYKRAGVDLVREQLAVTLGSAAVGAELTGDQIVLTGAGATAPSVAYRLRSTAPRLAPVALHGTMPGAWPAPARRDVLFADAPIAWDRWVRTWTNGAAEQETDEAYPPVLPVATPAAAG